jgi:hypothetical protein
MEIRELSQTFHHWGLTASPLKEPRVQWERKSPERKSLKTVLTKRWSVSIEHTEILCLISPQSDVN